MSVDAWPAWPAPLRALAEAGVERRYRRGLLLIQEGEPGGTLYFVLSGRLRAYRATADGQEFTYGRFGPGEVLGELSLDGGPRSANVEVETEARCRVVDVALLKRCMAEDPELAFELLCRVIQRARILSDRVSDRALNKSHARLVKLLLQESQAEPDGTRLTAQPWTHQGLAERLGCSRPMVTKLLNDLREGGYLRKEADGRWRLLKALPRK